MSALHASLYFPKGNYSAFGRAAQDALIESLALNFDVEKHIIVIDAVEKGSIRIKYQIQPPLGVYRMDESVVRNFRWRVKKGFFAFEGELLADALGVKEGGFQSTMEIHPDYGYPEGILGDGNSIALALVVACSVTTFFAFIAGIVQLIRYYDWVHTKEKGLKRGWQGLSTDERADFLEFDDADVEEEITAENEAAVAKQRFEGMMAARERERTSAPWVTSAAPGRSSEAGDGESRPPRTRVVINPRNGTVTGPEAASKWVMEYLGLGDLNYTLPGIDEDEGYAKFKAEEAAREDDEHGWGKGTKKETWTTKLSALMALAQKNDAGKKEEDSQDKEEKKTAFGFKLPGVL